MNFDTSPSPRDGRRCDKSTPDRGVETSLLCAPNACLSSSATLGTRSARHDACSEPSAVGEAQTRAVGPTAATSLRRRSQMCGTCKHCYMGQKQLLKAAGNQQTAGHPEPRVSVQTVGLSWECSGCFRVFSAAPPQGVAGLIRQSAAGFRFSDASNGSSELQLRIVARPGTIPKREVREEQPPAGRIFCARGSRCRSAPTEFSVCRLMSPESPGWDPVRR